MYVVRLLGTKDPIAVAMVTFQLFGVVVVVVVVVHVNHTVN